MPCLKRLPSPDWSSDLMGTVPMRLGEILTDVANNRWRIGRSIGVGAFGEIYLASDDLSKQVGQDAKYVVKVEPHTNGPLFVEMNFYLRTTKEEMMDEWKCKKGIKQLGIPRLYGFGSHMSVRGSVPRGRRRFLVLPRLGDDIHKVFIKHSKKFHVKTALTLAYHVLVSLEYVHDCGYVHSDIKAKNMVLGGGLATSSPVYLLDFGLASRYVYRSGVHKEYRFDGRKAEIGTLEFSSRDAHIGAVSRRSDLESLGYNLVRWLEGKLPWDSELSNPDSVKALKERAMANVMSFINSAFPHNNKPPDTLADYLLYVGSLEFDTRPDYDYCRRLFSKGIRDAGYLDDAKLTFVSHARLKPSSRKLVGGTERRTTTWTGVVSGGQILSANLRTQENRKPPWGVLWRMTERENMVQSKRKKLVADRNHTGLAVGPVTASLDRKPCSLFNHSADVKTRVMTRNCDVQGLENFNWAQVLATHPERLAVVQHHPEKKNVKRMKKKKRKKRITARTDTPDSPPTNNRCGEGGNLAKRGHNVRPTTSEEDDSLANPTPEMLRVMEMRRNTRKSSTKTNTHHSMSEVMGVMLTPAMAEVIANRRAASAPPAPSLCVRLRRRKVSIPRRYLPV